MQISIIILSVLELLEVAVEVVLVVVTLLHVAVHVIKVVIAVVAAVVEVAVSKCNNIIKLLCNY